MNLIFFLEKFNHSLKKVTLKSKEGRYFGYLGVLIKVSKLLLNILSCVTFFSSYCKLSFENIDSNINYFGAWRPDSMHSKRFMAETQNEKFSDLIQCDIDIKWALERRVKQVLQTLLFAAKHVLVVLVAIVSILLLRRKSLKAP